MKNRQGIIWAPILIIVTTIVIVGVAGYFLYKAGNTNETKNTNVAVINQAVSNTNSDANTNQVVNSNTSLNTNVTSNTNTASNTNTTTDATAGWKTYTNTKYGFSLRYPKEWGLSTDTPDAILQEPENSGASGGIFVLSYTTESPSTTLSKTQAEAEQKPISPSDSPSAYPQYGQPELITLDSRSVVVRKYVTYEISPNGLEYFVPELGFRFMITDLSGDNHKDDEVTTSLRNQILSTFQFTD